MVVFLIHFRDPGKISVLLPFSGSFAMENDNIHIFWLQIMNWQALFQTKMRG